MAGKTELTNELGVRRVTEDGLMAPKRLAVSIFWPQMAFGTGKGVIGADGLDPFVT